MNFPSGEIVERLRQEYPVCLGYRELTLYRIRC